MIRHSAVSLHSRGVNEPGPSTATSSHRTGDSSRPYSPYGHRRTILVPACPHSPSPYMQTGQSIPTFTTTYGYGSLNSRPSFPSTAGHLSHGLTHLARHSLPPHNILRGQSPHTSSETPTYSNAYLILPCIVLPIPEP